MRFFSALYPVHLVSSFLTSKEACFKSPVSCKTRAFINLASQKELSIARQVSKSDRACGNFFSLNRHRPRSNQPSLARGFSLIERLNKTSAVSNCPRLYSKSACWESEGAWV